MHFSIKKLHGTSERICVSCYINNQDFVVEQFTGITDETGKEIYEGDIVKIDNSPDLFAVFYNERFSSFDVATTENSIGWWKQSGFKIKVIGNIIENEKLL